MENFESDFTTTPYNFVRRFTGVGNSASFAFDLISDALNGIYNSNDVVTSPVKVLNRTPGNYLVVFFFTDADRSSDLLAGNPPVGDNSGFVSYTNFKLNHHAKFIVAIKPPSIEARNAAAAIASPGGNYSLGIEVYPANPEGSSLPRYLHTSGSFDLTDFQVFNISKDICGISCPDNLSLSSPIDNVYPSENDIKQSSNSIIATNIFYNNSTGSYHVGNVVYLKPGFRAVSGADFHAYIEECNGTLEQVVLKSLSDEPISEELDIEIVKLSPNPANTFVTVQSQEVMNTLTVTSIEGMVMYRGNPLQNSFDLNVLNFKKGIYVVTVETQKGEIIIKKLIKE